MTGKKMFYLFPTQNKINLGSDNRKLLIICMLVFSCIGCNAGDGSEENLDHDIVGTWKSQTLRVDVNSYQNKPGDEIFEVHEGQWLKKTGRQAPISHFQEDGGYYWEYINKEDSLIIGEKAKWKIVGDSLMIYSSPEPKDDKTYFVTIKNNLLTVTTMVDWDFDGSEDDVYIGTHTKIVDKEK